MASSQRPQRARPVRSERSPSRPWRSSGRAVALGAVALALGASLAAMASASASHARSASGVTVSSASNGKLAETVLVDGQGRTLYVLTPETAHHLLCKSRECLSFWPPLTVRSRTARLEAPAGVHGRLGILRRSNGALQVTLEGLPLYRFSGDRAKGEANGQHIHSFGGIWHVVPEAGNVSLAAPPTPASTETAPPVPAVAPPTTSTPTTAPAPPTPTTPTTTTPTTTTPTTPTTTTPTTPEPPYGY